MTGRPANAPPDALRPYRQMARNALLANARLHRACVLLGPGAWEARRVSFFPSPKAMSNRILMHLVRHDQHHRGQAHAMVSASPVTPPQLDEFITGDAAAARTADLAAMGRDAARLMQ